MFRLLQHSHLGPSDLLRLIVLLRHSSSTHCRFPLRFLIVEQMYGLTGNEDRFVFFSIIFPPYFFVHSTAGS